MLDARNVIYFNYLVRDSSGRPIDSSDGKSVSILQGTNHAFNVVEKEMLISPLKKKQRIPVKCVDAYGEYNNDLVVQISESKFKAQPIVGSRFKVKLTNNNVTVMTVVDKKDGYCILDGNHPLAGIDLVFEIEVLRRRPALENEIQSGKVRPEN